MQENILKRREVLFSKMPENSILIVNSLNNFYYLTGLLDVKGIAAFLKGERTQEFILFLDIDEDDVWTKPLHSREEIVKMTNPDCVFHISEFAEKAKDLLLMSKSVFCDIYDLAFLSRLNKIIAPFATLTRNGFKAPNSFIDYGVILNDMRMQKDKEELALMQKAIDVTANAQIRAQAKAAAGMFEYQIEAEIIHEFRNSGCDLEPAFASIVASGENACTLHYDNNNCQMKDGDLLLADIGAAYQHYCGDITRTFPVNKKFTPCQRAIYDLVLEIQLTVIEKAKAGVIWNDLQNLAVSMVARGLLKLGVISGTYDEVMKNKVAERFYPHKIGHFLGIECHDVGNYYENNKWQPLLENTVLTVEPGIYIPNHFDFVDPQWRGIGIRIEDDILIQKEGNIVLSAKAPK